MKTTMFVVFALVATMGSAFAQYHAGSTGENVHGGSTGGNNSERYDHTRIKKAPELVQTKEIGRVPLMEWVPAKGEFANESNTKQAYKGQWVTKGYKVTYRETYDNGTSRVYTSIQ